METVRKTIDGVLSVDPDAEAIEYCGEWFTWRQLAAVKAALETHLKGLGPNGRVAVLMRNRPEIVCAALAVIGQDQCLVTVNPVYPDDKVIDDLAQAQTPIIIASSADWERTAVASAMPLGGALCLEVRMDSTEPVLVRQGNATPLPEFVRAFSPGVAVEMLTSGTTGKPKRIPLKASDFEKSLLAAAAFESKRSEKDEPMLRSGVSLVTNSMAHTSGLSGVVNVILSGRKICLFEKFSVDEFIAAIRRHRPKVAGAPPAALRMIYDARPPADTFSSLAALRTGTAPLDPDLADAFYETYGVPVLQNYGATEFGGVAGWTMADFKEHRVDKRGSVGRISPGIEGRIVDPDTLAPFEAGADGVLQLKGARIGDGINWLTTTDLARLDADNFLYILGRADNAIIRGGFKIHADDVQKGLEQHPDVVEAAVVGIPDRRLGQVPVAACVLSKGSSVSAEEILKFARGVLAPYQVPVRLEVVAELPRTQMLKVSQPDVKALFMNDNATGDVS